MHFEPMELTEQDEQWMDSQTFVQNKIMGVYATPPERISGESGPTTTVTLPQEYTQEQKNLIRGMGICAEVARLYKQRGGAPQWTKRVEVEPGKFAWVKDETWENKPTNRAFRRSIRFTMIAERQPEQYACGTCNLPYIGPVTGRCQCKPVVLKRQQQLERAKELATKMREATSEAA